MNNQKKHESKFLPDADIFGLYLYIGLVRLSINKLLGYVDYAYIKIMILLTMRSMFRSNVIFHLNFTEDLNNFD